MALISRQELDTYIAARKALAEGAKSNVTQMLRELDYSDIATARNDASRIMQLNLHGATDAAAELTANLYDEIRLRALGSIDDFEAEPISGRKPDATFGFVRAAIQDAVNGNVDGFISKCGERCDYEVQRASGTCMYRNGYRDSKLVRYMRVPSGRETCAFCIMLASRGAVYYSRETAGVDDGHYHSNCDCVIVPVFMGSKISQNSVVEGHSVDDYKDKYNELLEAGVLNRKDLAKWSAVAKKRNGRSARRVDGTEGTMFPTGTRAMIRYLDGATSREDFERRATEVYFDFKKYWFGKRDWSYVKNYIDKLDGQWKSGTKKPSDGKSQLWGAK